MPIKRKVLRVLEDLVFPNASSLFRLLIIYLILNYFEFSGLLRRLYISKDFLEYAVLSIWCCLKIQDSFIHISVWTRYRIIGFILNIHYRMVTILYTRALLYCSYFNIILLLTVIFIQIDINMLFYWTNNFEKWKIIVNIS